MTETTHWPVDRVAKPLCVEGVVKRPEVVFAVDQHFRVLLETVAVERRRSVRRRPEFVNKSGVEIKRSLGSGYNVQQVLVEQTYMHTYIFVFVVTKNVF